MSDGRKESFFKSRDYNWADIGWMIALAMVAVGPILLVYQTVQWLRTGEWSEITIRLCLEWMGFNVPGRPGPELGPGLHNALDTLLSVPMWAAIPVTGALLVALFGLISDWLHRE